MSGHHEAAAHGGSADHPIDKARDAIVDGVNAAGEKLTEIMKTGLLDNAYGLLRMLTFSGGGSGVSSIKLENPFNILKRFFFDWSGSTGRSESPKPAPKPVAEAHGHDDHGHH